MPPQPRQRVQTAVLFPTLEAPESSSWVCYRFRFLVLQCLAQQSTTFIASAAIPQKEPRKNVESFPTSPFQVLVRGAGLDGMDLRFTVIDSKYGPPIWAPTWFFLVWVGFEVWGPHSEMVYSGDKRIPD